MKNIGFAGLSTLMCLVFAVPVMGQNPQPSAAEIACNGKYTKYFGGQDNLQLFNDFVNDATCKDSIYREGAFQLMTQAMTNKKDWKGLMDMSARLTKEMPNASAKAKQYVYGMGLTGASQLGDPDKMIENGEKVLTLDPNDINATLIVATTIPEKFSQPMEAAAKEAALKRAMELAKKLIGMTKPDPVDAKVWQISVLGPAHGVVGFVHLQRAEYEEAEAEFDQAVKINPKDQLSWYRYGLASTKIAIAAQALIEPAFKDVNDNFKTLGPERDAAVAKRDAIEKDFTDKRAKTIDIFISAVALPDPAIVGASRPTLESLYKPLHNNTTEGLAELIAARKAELNK